MKQKETVTEQPETAQKPTEQQLDAVKKLVMVSKLVQIKLDKYGLEGEEAPYIFFPGAKQEEMIDGIVQYIKETSKNADKLREPQLRQFLKMRHWTLQKKARHVNAK